MCSSDLCVPLLLAVVVIALTGAINMYGQATDGTLLGTVVDQSGAAVPAATVEITNVATNVKFTLMTNAEGEYRFNNVLVGNYDVRVTKTGFSAATWRAIPVALGKISTQNITLTVGTVDTTVEVTESATLIDTTTATVSSTFQQREAIDTPASSLPLGTLNLSLLNAGVANAGGIGLGDGPSVGGQRPRNNSFNVRSEEHTSEPSHT